VRIAALVSLLSFLLAGGLVGIRALRVARRTRRLPELLIGLGLLSITVLGYPFCAVGRLPALVATPLGDALFALGLAVCAAGIACVYAFTATVFRPGSPLARAAVGAASLALVLVAAGLVRAPLGAEAADFRAIWPHTRPWAGGIVALVMLAFAWTGAESARCYASQRRRRALGLADPVVANRFLLWSVAGFSLAALCAANLAYVAAGLVLMRDALPLATIAITGVVASAAWLLAFVPPPAYRRWLESRAAAAA